MAFYKTYMSELASKGEVLAPNTETTVTPGEVLVCKGVAGNDEYLILVSSTMDDDGIFQGAILHAAKKETLEIVKKLGSIQRFVFATNEEEVADVDVNGIALWKSVPGAEEVLKFNELAWISRTNKAVILDRLGTLRGMMTGAPKV